MNYIRTLPGNGRKPWRDYPAISYSGPAISRQIKLDDSFPFASYKVKRGRPSPIADDALKNRFDHLLGFFENHWADLAWDLDRSRSLPAIRAALRRPQGFSVSEVEPFTHEPTRKTTSKEVAALRRRISRLRAYYRTALADESRAKDRFDTAIHAADGDANNSRLRQFLSTREQQHASLRNQVAVFRTQLDELGARLRDEEAYFVQSELLDFITSGRYALTPVHYACAMAGLPYITWRQSADRCAKYKAEARPGPEFEKFRLVLKAFGSPPPDAAEAINRVKGFVKSKRPRDFVSESLRSEWYYLRVALETVYATPQPRTAIPYRVFAEYQKRASSRSPSDLLMAEDESL